MKIYLTCLSLFFVFVLCLSSSTTFIDFDEVNTNIVEMTLYDFNGSRLDESGLNLPERWNCRKQTCPEKFANKSENIFSLGRKDQPSIKIRVPEKVVNRLNRNNDLIGIVDIKQ